MAFLKNLFNSGGDAKQDYSSKIPDRLLPKDFQVHQTFQHGFPYQPSCLAYDSVQKLLAIGSHSGTIVLIGQPGLECHFTQENDGLTVPVLQLQFVENKGLLVSRCGDNSLYLWNIKGREPVATHRLEFQKDQLCYFYIPYESDWLYAGMEEGNVYIVNSKNLELSGYTIFWDKAVESGLRKSKPGDVLCIEECPVDDNKILISFTGGLISLWNLKHKTAEKRFKHSSSKSLCILMSVSWNGSGKQFAGAYSDGTVGIFNIKNEGKPEKIISPHGSLSNNSPIGKLRWFHTDPEPWKIFTGGYPELEGSGIRSLTLQTSQQTHLMTFKDPIIDFICLPSSPFSSDIQKTFALTILTQNELLLYDLQSTGVPNFNNPFCFDIHYSPVTSLVYCGNCPDDFIAQLHSVKSKLPHTPASTKQWPLRGGRWGDESPDPWTDLILTGHLDGTVRFWFCRSVVMQPLFTISTSCYFKSEQSPTDHAPNRSPRPHRKTSSEQETIREEPLTPATPTSAPPISVLSPPIPDVNIIEEPDSETTPISDAATPSSEAPPLLGGNPSPNPIGRRSVISREKKSVFKKAKKGIKSRMKKKGNESPDVEGGARGGAETPDDTESVDGMEEGSIPDDESPTKPKHLPLFTRKKSSDSLKAVSVTEGGGSSVGRRSPDDYVVVSLINNVSCKKSEELAVHQSYFCPYSQNLSVANISGHVLVFDFSLPPTEHKPQTLLVNMSNDTVCFGDTLRDKKHERLSLPLSFNEDRDQLLPGFYVKQHVFLYTRCNDTLEPVDVTAIKYWEQSKLLAIGSETGLVIIDININQILHVLGNITSILYLADPGTYSKMIRKASTPVLNKAGSIGHKLIEKKLTTPLIIPSMELPHVDEGGGAAHHGGKIKVGKHPVVPDDCLVTCVELVQFFLNKTQSSLITLWVATYSGNISVYSIKSAAVTRNGKSNIEIMPTGLVIERKSPVVQLHFLNEWGEQLVSPYKTTNDGNYQWVWFIDIGSAHTEVASVLKKRQIEKETNDTQKPVNYVVMVTKDSLRCVGFPGNQVINNIDITDSHHIVHSGLFTCDGLPCHLSLLSDGVILINTLPGLKSMIKYQSNYLHSSRALYTFRISGNGQAMFQTTPSQFQRLAVTAHDNLNIPLSRPIMHQLLEGPTHNKGLLQMLVGAATSPGDKQDIFGIEAAGKAWKSVATKYDLLAVKEKERETKDKKGRKGGGGGASPTDGSGNAFTQARQKLDKRGEDLSRIEEQTEKLATDADDFASVAERLAEKYRKKRF